jgi:3-oxoacyl-[acyl-carrier protein] reductase
MNRFQGRVAVVSGGARGIGRAVSEQLAAEGAKVAIVSRNEASCSKAAQEINRTHPDATRHYAVDIADFEAMQETGKQIIADFGEVNILVNNAGITRDKLFLLMREDDWDAVLDTNLKGAFNAIKAFQRSLLRARDPRIINISSVTGLLGNAGQANYAASKAGLLGLTKSIARELSSRQVTCNAVAPGFIDTDMTAGLSEAIQNEILNRIPLSSFGNSKEVASLILYLASPAARYITGQVIAIDGGMAM